jgi:periplasmic glucans biosynthesis protein
MRRRAFLATAAAALAAPAGRARAGTASLLDAARALAGRAYVPNTTPLPPPFAGLDYDAYRGIRPREGLAATLPQGPGWVADLLPPGLYFPDPVRIDLPSGEVPFSPALFSFEPRYFGTIPATAPGAGFSGLRLRHALNAPGRMDEVMVVQGASYFRAIGRAMAYGLSARAVAIGTGGAGPEEFPRFTRLRLHPPQGDTIRLEGLIDSPSLAGHMDLTLRPGADTEMDVSVTLLPRVRIADVGVAPLTSMYLKGTLHTAVSDDFRPRVHDSDVLVIDNGGGETVWRPIANPARVETSAFADAGPRAFGLHQTERRFDGFEDSEAHYHDRPSAIVRPRGDWGRGAVMLVEIPTGTEFMDNIVAFWRPEAALEAGGEYRFDYRLSWTLSAPAGGDVAILQSRSGREHHLAGHAPLRRGLRERGRGVGAGCLRCRGGGGGLGREPVRAARGAGHARDLPSDARRGGGGGAAPCPARRGRAGGERRLAAPLDAGAGRRGLAGLAQVHLRRDGPVVRGGADAGAVQHLGPQDAARRGHEKAVERQERARGGEGRPRGSGEVQPRHAARQGEPAPGPPFVQVAPDQRGARAAPEEVLPERAHLRDAERLAQRQMRAHKADRKPRAGCVHHHRAPVAVAGEVHHRHVLDRDGGVDEDDHAEKAVALRAPARGRAVDMGEPRGAGERREVEEAPVRRAFLVGLGQDQDLAARAPDLGESHVERAGGVHHAVIAACAVDVPACAGEGIGHGRAVREGSRVMPPPLAGAGRGRRGSPGCAGAARGVHPRGPAPCRRCRRAGRPRSVSSR